MEDMPWKTRSLPWEATTGLLFMFKFDYLMLLLYFIAYPLQSTRHIVVMEGWRENPSISEFEIAQRT
jgi:hypothetical protein